MNFKNTDFFNSAISRVSAHSQELQKMMTTVFEDLEILQRANKISK